MKDWDHGFHSHFQLGSKWFSQLGKTIRIELIHKKNSPGLSLRVITHNTCYGQVCLISPLCYGWNCLLLIQFNLKVTSLLWVWRMRLQVIKNVMTALLATRWKNQSGKTILTSHGSICPMTSPYWNSWETALRKVRQDLRVNQLRIHRGHLSFD